MRFADNGHLCNLSGGKTLIWAIRTEMGKAGGLVKLFVSSTVIIISDIMTIQSFSNDEIPENLGT